MYSLMYTAEADKHPVRQAGAGGWSWSCVRGKHCCLTGGWRLELELYEREILQRLEQPPPAERGEIK
jgi:hypothetical protein